MSINRKRFGRIAIIAAATALVAGGAAFSPAEAAGVPVGFGTATPYSVIGGSAVSNTGPSVLDGGVGLSPDTALTGFPPGLAAGATHVADAEAAQAKLDVIGAYNDAAGRTPATAVATELGGNTLVAGVYSGGELGITGDLTLDAQGDPTAVFVFQAASTLTTGAGSRVVLLNGASSCNVVWQVGSSASLGVNSSFAGTVLALTSITATTGATINGRLFARNGAVTLDTNTFTGSTCAVLPVAAPPTTTPGSTPPDSTPPDSTTPGSTPDSSAPGSTGPAGGDISVPPGATISTLVETTFPTSNTLPATGSTTDTTAIGAVGVLAIGGAAVLVARRRPVSMRKR